MTKKDKTKKTEINQIPLNEDTIDNKNKRLNDAFSLLWPNSKKICIKGEDIFNTLYRVTDQYFLEQNSKVFTTYTTVDYKLLSEKEQSTQAYEDLLYFAENNTYYTFVTDDNNFDIRIRLMNFQKNENDSEITSEVNFFIAIKEDNKLYTAGKKINTEEA